MAPEVLRELVVQSGESGARAAGLERNTDSGPVDQYARAAETVDPDDTPSGLVARGYTGGYELVDVARLSVREGAILEISTSVDAFRSSRAAARFLARDVASQRAARGATFSGGIRYLDVTVSDAGGPAGAKLIRVRARARGVVFYPTLVVFRRGRIVGTAVIARKGRPPDAADVERLARKLDRRIESRVSG